MVSAGVQHGTRLSAADEIRIRRADDASDGEPVREIIRSYNVSHSASLRLTGRTIGIVEDVRALTGHAVGWWSPVVIALNDMDRTTISTLKPDLHG